MNDEKRSIKRRRLAGLSVILGLVMAGAQAHGGHTYSAIFSLVLFGCMAAWHLFGKGDFLDTMLQLDERQMHVVSKSRELTGVVMAWIMIVWATCDIAQGILTSQVITLAAASGGVFLASVLYFRYKI